MPRNTWTPEETARARALVAKVGLHDAAKLLGRTYDALEARLRRVRPPRGPSQKPAIPEGHELSGVSTLTDANGGLKAEWAKTRVAGDPEPAPPPPDFALRRLSTMQRGDGSEVIRWASYDREAADRFAAWERAVAGLVATVPAAVAVASPDHTDADTLTVYPLGDPHIGMLAWSPEVGADFDSTIAVRDLSAAMALLVDGAPASERATIVNLGDYFHADDDSQRTPQSGHKLDVDTRRAKIFEAGLVCFRGMIDRALTKHRAVRVVNIPGNHDPNSAFVIASVLRAWYRDEPRVDVDPATSQFAYDRHGLNLIGYCHGPGAGQRHERLAGVMSTDQARAWGETEFRVWHTGDVHHLSRKEFPGVVVETHRTLATRDAWHHRSGYRSGQSLETITYHREFGEVARARVTLRRVREGKGAK